MKEELAKEEAELAAARALHAANRGTEGAETSRSDGLSADNVGGLLDQSVTYNLLVLAGVVVLAFAVRYVIISASGDDGSYG